MRAATDAGADLHLDFLRSRRAQEGEEERADHAARSIGLRRFPKQPITFAYNFMGVGGVASMIFRARRATRNFHWIVGHACECLPRHAGAAFQAKEHGLLERAAPCKIWGFPPPDSVANRHEDSSGGWESVGRDKTCFSIQQKCARPQPGGRNRRTYRSRASELRQILNTSSS